MISIGYSFGSLVIQCATNDSDVCGTNGLPITPSSVAMIGTFKSIVDNSQSQYLTQYLDCYRNKKEKVTLIFEHYLYALPVTNDYKLVNDCLLALYDLHYNIGCVHGLITPEAIVFDGINVKLTHWCVNAITDCGHHCNANIILPSIVPNDIRFISGEQLFGIGVTRKTDVWSLALSLLAVIDPKVVIAANPIDIINCTDSQQVLLKLNAKIKSMPNRLQEFFNAALEPIATHRATVKELLTIVGITQPQVETQQLNTFLRFSKLDNSFKRETLTINEVYYLWCVSFPSRDESENKSPKRAPILSLPTIILSEDSGVNNDTVKRNIKFIRLPSNNELKLLPIEKLLSRLNQLQPHVFFPLLLSERINTEWHSPNLPIVIRENDFDYQCERITIFRRLIEGSPFVRQQLLCCAKVDIPPLYRAHIWSSILNVKWSDLLLYEQIDKITPTPTDRQISVDIPRCHQYNDLLASPQGHIKLTRILKAWLRHNESNGDVYWQGLDSLAAPFIVINFNNESQAFSCFNAFINKYLKGFFQRDNSHVIQEYLAIFSLLISYHDPILANHLNSLSFVPDLYAIPWFLTMFTHVLPLHQIMHLWDTLLLENESFPLFIGLSILHQLRDQLLEFTFNDCILIFSDLPQIDIDKCASFAIKLFNSTPKSICQIGLWPLHQLRDHSVPKIDIYDVIALIKCEKSRIVIIDGRSKSEITQFGLIRNSISTNGAVLDYNDTTSNDNVVFVVVNDYEMAHKLIMSSVYRVCLLQLSGYVPNELLA